MERISGIDGTWTGLAGLTGHGQDWQDGTGRDMDRISGIDETWKRLAGLTGHAQDWRD
jgi:hypothetical protein